MRGLLIRFAVSAAALALTARLLPGIHIEGADLSARFQTVLIASVLLGVFNAIIRPILILLTLPLNILTLGLFTFVINAALLFATAYFVKGFQIDGFIPALVGSVALAIISGILNWLVKDAREKHD